MTYIDELIAEYNRVRDNVLAETEKLDKLREQIAKRIEHKYRGREGSVTQYFVAPHNGRAHRRRGYGAVRITGGRRK